MANQIDGIFTHNKALERFCVNARQKRYLGARIIAELASARFKITVTESQVHKRLTRTGKWRVEIPETAEAGEELTAEMRADQEREEWERQRQQLERKYKIALAEQSLADRLIAKLETTVEALEPVKPPRAFTPSREAVQESAVLVGSCWHIGEVINKEEMDGLNEYNIDIFARRLQHIVEKAISFTHGNMSNHLFETLHVILTGDMVSGIIHEELVETNEVHIVDQALIGALITAQALQDLARAFPRVVVTGVVGNHGRTQPQKQFKHKGTKSWDYVFYNALAILLKNQPNIQFIIPKSYWAVVDVEGHLFQVSHGDNIRGSLGIPFYGFKREVGKWAEINAVQNRIVRYYISSHFHTKAVLQTGIGELIMNSSLKGGDEYAIGLGLYGDPMQLLFGVHERYGKSWELSLNAKNTDLEKPLRYQYNLTKPLAYQLASVA